MAVTLNASASAGLVATADTSTILQLQTGGTTAVTVDASQNVGIGTTSPIRPLQVGSYGSGNGEIALGASTTGYNSILFGDSSANFYQGYVQYQHNGDFMVFATAAAERARIDSSGNLGIGTSSPAARLSITAGTMQSHLLLGANTSNTNYGSISLNGISADVTRLGFTGGGTGDNTLYIDVPTSGQYAFRRGGTQVMTLNSSGNLQTIGTISVGNATPTTSGAGITFPATQSASSDANTLDDYEEGTWTPIDSSGAGLTFTDNSGTYVKIGSLCYITGYLSFPSTASGANAIIGGLPFAASGPTEYNNYGPPIRNNKSLSMQVFGVDGAKFVLLPIGNYTTYVLNSAMTSGTMQFSLTYRTA